MLKSCLQNIKMCTYYNRIIDFCNRKFRSSSYFEGGFFMNRAPLEFILEGDHLIRVVKEGSIYAFIRGTQ